MSPVPTGTSGPSGWLRRIFRQPRTASAEAQSSAMMSEKAALLGAQSQIPSSTAPSSDLPYSYDQSRTPSPLDSDARTLRRHRHALTFYTYRHLLAIILISIPLLALAYLPEFPSPNRYRHPLQRAHRILGSSPLIDLHVDLPIVLRVRYGNHLEGFDLGKEKSDGGVSGHVSVPLLKRGKVGGMFWSVYVACPEDAGYDDGPDYVNATWRVRDTLEQIDIAKLSIAKYGQAFGLARTSKEIVQEFKRGRVASLLGVEGAHQIGNSIAVLRQFYDLGVRYMTLTHTCNNAVADSAGMEGRDIEERWGGLSEFGKVVVHEMNRLGMIVDISHTSDKTASAVLSHSLAPPIFSHSNARAIHPVRRNVPDSILEQISLSNLPNSTVRSKDALVAITFAPQFVSDGGANLGKVADHIEYVAKLAGRDHVGLGSDFDGIGTVPVGLEDISKYPHLIAELIGRGWKDEEVRGLIGGNFLRIFARVEEVKKEIAASGSLAPATDVFSKRWDL